MSKGSDTSCCTQSVPSRRQSSKSNSAQLLCFPIQGAVWDAAQATVEITVRHHEAKSNVVAVLVPRSCTPASFAVTWCALASP